MPLRFAASAFSLMAANRQNQARQRDLAGHGEIMDVGMLEYFRIDAEKRSLRADAFRAALQLRANGDVPNPYFVAFADDQPSLPDQSSPQSIIARFHREESIRDECIECGAFFVNLVARA